MQCSWLMVLHCHQLTLCEVPCALARNSSDTRAAREAFGDAVVEHDLCVRLLDHIVRLLLAADPNTSVCATGSCVCDRH